jgi:hypothetical protein
MSIKTTYNLHGIEIQDERGYVSMYNALTVEFGGERV